MRLPMPAMFPRSLAALALSSFVAGCAGAAGLQPFEFSPEAEPAASAAARPVCALAGLQLPENVAVFAAGAYSGRKLAFQIDQSGHEGTQIDVAVNSSARPVVLMLGAYEPTIWNIGWSPGTRILAVLVSGYHRQAVAGLQAQVPQLNSSYDNRGPCGYFYIGSDNLAALNPMARRVFGRPVDMVFPAENGRVVVGDALRAGTRLLTSPEVAPASFRDPGAPLAGPAGLEDAVRRGVLRRATAADADAWADAVMRSSPPRDLPPVAGQGVPRPPRPSLHNAYVVLKPFTLPAGLFGAHAATLLVPVGVPRPEGNAGHSTIYDFNTLQCRGTACSGR